MSYTVAKLHSRVDPIHRYTESLKPYLARQIQPKRNVIYMGEAAEEEVILCAQRLLNRNIDLEHLKRGN